MKCESSPNCSSGSITQRADEVWIKVDGKQNYLFASMDDDTRYWLASDMVDNKFHHNADNLLELTKKHGSLKGKTPAQEAMIEIDGKNKWKTIIQNASLNKATE